MEAFEKALKIKLNRVARYVTILILIFASFIISIEGIINNAPSKTNEDAENNTVAYKNYLDHQAEIIKNLSAQKQEIRKNAINELQHNPIYQRYSKEISAQYLPILDALGQATRTSSDSSGSNPGYYLRESTEGT